MKDFFKKLWEAIKAFFTKVKEAICFWLGHLPYTIYVLFIVGTLLTAFIAIVFPGAIEWPAVPVLALALIVCFVKAFRDKAVDWREVVAYVLGAISIQLFCWLA